MTKACIVRYLKYRDHSYGNGKSYFTAGFDKNGPRKKEKKSWRGSFIEPLLVSIPHFSFQFFCCLDSRHDFPSEIVWFQYFFQCAGHWKLTAYYVNEALWIWYWQMKNCACHLFFSSSHFECVGRIGAISIFLCSIVHCSTNTKKKSPRKNRFEKGLNDESEKTSRIVAVIVNSMRRDRLRWKYPKRVPFSSFSILWRSAFKS